MMNLAAKANASISASYGKFSGGVSWDSIKDDLAIASGRNAVMCDSKMNCIVRDTLYCSGESCN